MASVKFGASGGDNSNGTKKNASSFYHNRYGNTDDSRRDKEVAEKKANADPTAIFDLETAWFNAKFPVKKCTIKDIATFKIDSDQVNEYYRNSQTAMENETERLARLDHKRWAMDHFQQRGTVADRIASAALELSNPAQITARSLNAFTVLFDIAQHDSHHFDAALNALVAVWPRLLPPRPLRKFSAQYFATLPEDENKRNFVIVHWLLEDMLKRTYTQFLTLAEVCLKDRLTQRRESWLNACGRLLPRVTEGRPTLIALIVDKLGDPNKTMAHKAYHQLLDMLCESSTYQSVLLTELEKLALSNKTTTTKGRSYCIQVLAQFVFNKDEQKLALKVIEVYLALLRSQLAAGEADYSSTTSIIVGMRRAFPYAGTNFSVLEEHVDTLFAFAATGPFLQRIHALSLVHQLYTKGWKSLEHRFYRALYASLLVPSAQLPHSSQLAGYFTLLFKALRQDASHSTNNQLLQEQQQQQNHNEDAAQTSSANQQQQQKDDEHSIRIASFIHRMLQQCAFHNEAYVCSMLLMVGEFSRVSPLVAELLSPTTTTSTANNNNNKNQNQNQNNNKKNKNGNGNDNKTSSASAATAANPTGEAYDPRHRDPRFSNLATAAIAASKSDCYFELNLLANHSHPSVQRLAKALLNGDVIAFDVHPLDDLTLIHFLDMVSEGKTTAKKRPESEGKGVPVFHRNPHVPMLPKASDAAFAKVHPSAVDPNALFLHRFAHQRLKFLNDTRPKWKDIDLLQQEADKMKAKINDNRNAHFGPRPNIGTALPADTKANATSGNEANNNNKDKTKETKEDDKQTQNNANNNNDDQFVEFNWGRLEDDEAWQENTSRKLTRREERLARMGVEPGEAEDDEDEDPFDYSDEDDDDDFGADFGQGRGDDDDDDDDGLDAEAEDDEDDEDEFGNKGEVDADGADDFDNELMMTENMNNDRRRRRERAWLEKATGEAPATPFNNAGKKNVGGKSKQPRQKRR